MMDGTRGLLVRHGEEMFVDEVMRLGEASGEEIQMTDSRFEAGDTETSGPWQNHSSDRLSEYRHWTVFCVRPRHVVGFSEHSHWTVFCVRPRHFVGLSDGKPK